MVRVVRCCRCGFVMCDCCHGNCDAGLGIGPRHKAALQMRALCVQLILLTARERVQLFQGAVTYLEINEPGANKRSAAGSFGSQPIEKVETLVK